MYQSCNMFSLDFFGIIPILNYSDKANELIKEKCFNKYD